MPSPKKYLVSATCRVECSVEVEASNPEQALEAARAELETNDVSQWSFVDGLKLTSWAEKGKDQETYL